MRGKTIFWTAIAVLFLCQVKVGADGVLVSTFSPTPVVPGSQFTQITLAMQNNTTNFIYLLGYPDGANNCPNFITNGYRLNPVSTSSSTLILPSYHGDLYACAPGATSPQLLNFLGGQ